MNKAAAQRGAESTNTATGSKTTVGRPGCPPAAQQGVDGTEGGKGGDGVEMLVAGTDEEEESSDIEDDSGQQDGRDLGVFTVDDSAPEATQEVFDPASVVIVPEAQPYLPDQKYLKALKEGYLELSQVIWKEEQPANRPALKELTCDIWDDNVIGILATMPQSLLLELISGNIAREYCKRSGKVWDVLRHYKTRGSSQPSIYVQVLADDRGESPSCNELTQMIGFLRAYMEDEDDKLAYDVDRPMNSHWTPSKAQDGARKYLSTDKRKNAPHQPRPSREKKLERFCDKLEARIKKIPKAQWDEPFLGHPVTEVGYALNATKRFQQHKDHTSSNWLMNLLEAVSVARFQGRFTMHQFVVFFIWDQPQAIIGECLFSKLCRSYIDDGGCNYASAGSSNWSILDLSDMDLWRQFQSNTLANTTFNENIDNYERQLRERWEEREQAKAENIAARAQLELLEAQLAALEAMEEG